MNFIKKDFIEKKDKNNFLNADIWLIVLHPVEYQSPFYEELYKESKGNSLVIFMDDLTIKISKLKDWGSKSFFKVRESNKPKNFKFNYLFSNNLSIFKETLFIGRINPGLIFNLIKNKPQMIIITSYTSVTNFAILILAPFLKTKVCLRAEGGIKGRPHLINRKGLFRFFIDKLINRADYFFYSCKDNMDYFLLRGVKQNKLYPILSSVNNKYFSEIKFQAKKDKGYFLIASKLEKRKNILEAIEGFKKYRKKLKKNSPLLLIAGTGPEVELIKSLTNSHIIYIGYMDDKSQIRKLIQESLGLVISSLYDPSPKTINESFACAKPVLCRNTIGTSGDLVEHLKNGYIYSPEIKDDILLGFDWIEKNSKNNKVKNFCLNKSKEWSPQQNAKAVMSIYKEISKKSFY